MRKDLLTGLNWTITQKHMYQDQSNEIQNKQYPTN